MLAINVSIPCLPLPSARQTSRSAQALACSRPHSLSSGAFSQRAARSSCEVMSTTSAPARMGLSHNASRATRYRFSNPHGQSAFGIPARGAHRYLESLGPSIGVSVLWADRGTALRTSEQNPQLSWRFQPVEHVHLLGSLGPPLKVAPVLGRRGGNFTEKTFPRLVQTGEGSSVNSTGTNFMEKTPPLAALDVGRLLHKLDSKQNPA